VTKWQRANSIEEFEAIVGGWPHYGVLPESLTNEDIEYLKTGGYLCVFQSEYGLVLRHTDTLPAIPHSEESGE
jgi:hypothetical protein